MPEPDYEYFRTSVPKGQHLGNSREQGDGVVGHLFSDDDNKLKGHAVWEKVEAPDEDDYSSSNYEPDPPRQLTQEEIERAMEAAALIVIGVIKGVQWASPRVKRWWVGTASPRLKAMRERLRGQKKSEASQTVHLGSATASRATFVVSSTGIERAVERSKVRMSSAEWQQRLQAMFAAGAFQEEQRRILSNAQIEDDQSALEASSTAPELTPREVARQVQQLLEANPSLLTDANFAELMKVLRRPSDAAGDGDLALQA